MRFVFEASARDVPFVVARAVNVNKLRRPPPWLIAAKRTPPAPSLTYRPRKWNDVSASTEWEKPNKGKTAQHAARYVQEKQAKQSVNPDSTAAGWSTAYSAAFRIRPHSHFVKSQLKRKEKRYMEYLPVIRYPEDSLRRRFYQNHPFELIRPTTMVEENALNTRDWSRLDGGVDAPLTGEDVVKYQYYLMRAKKVPRVEAYNRVVSQFYKIRARDEVALRVAEEQAIHHGAITNPTGFNSLDKALEHEEEMIQRSYEHMDKILQTQKMRKVASERSYTTYDVDTVARMSPLST